MREEYDCSNAVRNPSTKAQKTPVTIRLDTATVEYFKGLSAEVNMPYQTLINAYLADCAAKKRKLVIAWED